MNTVDAARQSARLNQYGLGQEQWVALQVAQGQDKGVCGMQYALGAGILDSCLVFGVLAIAAIGKCNLAFWIHASSRLAIGKQ